MTNYKVEIIKEFARKTKEAGFKVYLSYNSEYGLFTDEKGLRIITFQYESFGGVSISGNYKGSKYCGIGWQIGSIHNFSKEGIMSALYTPAPNWANPNPVYTTLAEHLKTYSSSKYEEFK